MILSHAELVERAAQWLMGRGRCGVVCTEWSGPRQADMPDAIGWSHAAACTVVECKTSMSDYYADSRKFIHCCPFGHHRWYLCKPGVLRSVREGWGLLWCYPSQVRIQVPAPLHVLDAEAVTRQSQYLFNAARRLFYMTNGHEAWGMDRLHLCPGLMAMEGDECSTK